MVAQGDDVILDTNGGSASGGAGNDPILYSRGCRETPRLTGGSGTDTAWIVGDGGFGENGVRLAAGDHSAIQCEQH